MLPDDGGGQRNIWYWDCTRRSLTWWPPGGVEASAGAAIDMTDIDGDAALCRAVYFGKDDSVKVLALNGENSEATDHDDDTPLLIAGFLENLEIEILLLREPASRQPHARI